MVGKKQEEADSSLKDNFRATSKMTDIINYHMKETSMNDMIFRGR